MTEPNLFLDVTKSDGTTVLTDDVDTIIFKFNWDNVLQSAPLGIQLLNYKHIFDAGDGYNLVMKIKQDWLVDAPPDGINIYDRLGFVTRESGTDWENGNVPWFRKTVEKVVGNSVWGHEADSIGYGWILPYNLLSLNNTDYADVANTVDVNGFIPINYDGASRFISWHFEGRGYSVENINNSWEIKITRVPIDNADSGSTDPNVSSGSGSSVTCMGDGVYNITNTGSITCS